MAKSVLEGDESYPDRVLPATVQSQQKAPEAVIVRQNVALTQPLTPMLSVDRPT